MNRRVVITGLGRVSSIGTGVTAFGQALRAGTSGISAISSFDSSGFPHYMAGEVPDFDPKALLRTIRPPSAGSWPPWRTAPSPAVRSPSMSATGSFAGLAVRTGATRLIVKTPAESYRIPTIEENVEALEFAGAAAAAEAARTPPAPDTGIAAEARRLIEAVLDLHPDVGQALVRAFAKGYLDVPYCLHADNHGRSRGYIDEAGRLRWASVGSMPIRGITGGTREHTVGSSELLSALSYVERTHDLLALRSRDTRTSDALDAGTTAADLRQA
ncbi:hypothetical protein ACEYXF_34525 [Streptomyces asiaticus]|uniref:hypothetical protein n=1 Tax=Streptomyces asiaticus TaxID=114695 RepID=UPI0039BDB64C